VAVVVCGADVTPAPIDQAAEYCWRLWSDLEGFACLCQGVDPYVDPAGKYKHRDFRPEFFRWPKERVRLYKRAIALADSKSPPVDVYVAPALRDRPRRTAETALPARFLWADVDGDWTAGRQASFTCIAGPGSFIVSSGRGHHAYIKVERPVEPDQLVQMNQHLGRILHADAKHDAAAVLRLLGSWNWKPTVFKGWHPAYVWIETVVGGVPC
jgi:hypothetical protein